MIDVSESRGRATKEPTHQRVQNIMLTRSVVAHINRGRIDFGVAGRENVDFSGSACRFASRFAARRWFHVKN